MEYQAKESQPLPSPPADPPPYTQLGPDPDGRLAGDEQTGARLPGDPLPGDRLPVDPPPYTTGAEDPAHVAVLTVLKGYLTTAPGVFRVLSMMISFCALLSSLVSYWYHYKAIVHLILGFGLGTTFVSLCLHLYEYVRSLQRGKAVVGTANNEFMNFIIYAGFSLFYAASGIVCATQMKSYNKALTVAMIFIFMGSGVFLIRCLHHWYSWRRLVRRCLVSRMQPQQSHDPVHLENYRPENMENLQNEMTHEDACLVRDSLKQ